MQDRQTPVPPRRGANSWILGLALALMTFACIAAALGVRAALRPSAASPPASQAAATEPPVRAATPALVFPSPTPAPTATPTAAPSPTPAPDDRKRYREVRADVLATRANELKSQPVRVSGTIYIVELAGGDAHVQLEAPGKIFIWAFFKGSPEVKKGQAATVYGTAAGLTTITADNGKKYQQPLIDPAQFIDVR